MLLKSSEDFDSFKEKLQLDNVKVELVYQGGIPNVYPCLVKWVDEPMTMMEVEFNDDDDDDDGDGWNDGTEEGEGGELDFDDINELGSSPKKNKCEEKEFNFVKLIFIYPEEIKGLLE
jgi:hypothetical protein